jgi:hypothetical protein
VSHTPVLSRKVSATRAMFVIRRSCCRNGFGSGFHTTSTMSINSMTAAIDGFSMVVEAKGRCGHRYKHIHRAKRHPANTFRPASAHCYRSSLASQKCTRVVGRVRHRFVRSAYTQLGRIPVAILPEISQMIFTLPECW